MADQSAAETLALRVLDSCKAEIYLNLKFLWIAMNRLKALPGDTPETLGTDGNAIYCNTKWLLSAYRTEPKRINRGLVHLMLHCVFRHFSRGRKERFPDLWDLACDIHVQELIDGFQLPFLEDGKESLRRAAAEGLKPQVSVFTAEGIYRFLESHPEVAETVDRSLFFSDDHGMWQYDDGDFSSGGEESEREEDWQEIAGKVLADMQFFHQNNQSAALARDLSVSIRKKISYREFLQKMLVGREVVKEDPEEFDYIFYSYGLSLYGNMPLLEQLEYRDEGALSDVVVVVDTSGSTFGDLAERFLEQTYSVVRAAGGGKFRLRVLQCDEAVQSDDLVESEEAFQTLMKNFTLRGGGGTDFRPAFDYVDELLASGKMQRVKGVIYFTDGKGIYPKTVRPYDVAFVFYGEQYEDKKVPPWAMKLLVGEEELKRI